MRAGSRILTLNAGSSSLKFALYAIGPSEKRLFSGAVEGIGARGRSWLRGSANETIADEPGEYPGLRAALDACFAALQAHSVPEPDAVGHRIVHGGPDHFDPERVDARLIDTLRRLVPFAPLHLPGEIELIEAVAVRLPALAQVVCYDTAFHRDMPEVARRLPLPRELWDQGIRRYGFHGLSYEYVVETVGAAALGRAVIAHLGNGASMTAVRSGRSVDTTMGFSPTGGLMMGTRSGDLDPGVMLHLLREHGYGAAELERVVDHESGLRGVSGITSDMKTLLVKRAEDPNAVLAIEMFCYQLRKHIGAFAAVLGGLDTVVFTGGIGERAAAVRAGACAGLAHLGIRLDDERNREDAAIVSAAESACMVRVVATDEDAMIARHVRAVLEREEDAADVEGEGARPVSDPARQAGDVAAPLAVIAGATATKKE